MMITNTEVKDWLDEIKDARKRDKDFRNNGETINEIYDGEKSDKIPFNILYSNTETLMPALYSQTPRPVVKRRFNQEVSPLVKAVEKAGTRILEYFLDTNIDGYEKFDDSMLDAVLDAALPGRGVTQIKFDAIMSGKKLKWAVVCADSRKYDQVYFGFAKKWSKMPWVAFEDYLDEEECLELFDKEKVKEIIFTESEEEDITDKSSNKSSRKTARIYQIWNKSDKTVKWISDSYDGFLKEQEDPLNITGFFPMPKPLQLHKKANNLTPTALYTLYENQAKELNRITIRLNRVIEAIKARGIYDGALGDDIEKIMNEDDNTLIPTDKGASLVEGGFDKAFWFVPIEKMVTVAQALMVARDQTKSVIYEITGLSDIIRGHSKASETLGAQKIKESWGTMRLKNMQKGVQFYVRDSLRIMLDIASTKIPIRFWKDLTGLDFPMNEDREKVRKQLESMKQKVMEQAQAQKAQAQQMQQAGQQVPPQKPPPPPPPELLKIAQSPTWEEILEILKDDFIRSYKVDIETNSTLDVEATEDQKQVAEFMNAMAQFMNGIQPMIEAGTLPFNAAKEMMLEITRRYRFGVDVEEQIKSMKEPQKPNGEQLKKQMEAFKKKTQETQKGFEGKQKELKVLQDKIEQQKQKSGDELDKRFNKLEIDKMQFDFDKKLFAAEQKLNEKAAVSELQMKETLSIAKQGVNQVKAESKLKSIVDDQSRNVQSMMDKHQAGIEKASEKITQIPEESPKKKIIKFTFDKEGKPDGATVDETDTEQESGDIKFEYENGKPVGATVN